MKTWIKRLLLLTILAALTGAGGLAWYARQPLHIEALPKSVNVTPGMNLRTLSTMLKREGVIGNAPVFWLLGRVLGKGSILKFGVYTLDQPLTPLALYARLELGDVT